MFGKLFITLMPLIAFSACGGDKGNISPMPEKVVVDSDLDGIKNMFDNCPSRSNANQDDLDRDGVGDVCDDDLDGDDVANEVDNCPSIANSPQLDTDSDKVGDACDVTPDDGIVNANIKASRTECASPCTVVFSAEDTTADGFTADDVWLSMSYYWDFDTDETDTYGSLYEQSYTYVSGDTAFEKGHVPMATKTFLCDTGTCTYRVGLRAQTINADYDDAYVTIYVESESTHWNAAKTICVSNTLTTSADWSTFDDPLNVWHVAMSKLLWRD